jgi:hypothetical protein
MGVLDNEEFDIDLIDLTLEVLGPDDNDWQILQRQLSVGASA